MNTPFVCERCAEPVIITWSDEAPHRAIAIQHGGCQEPIVKMLCDNPRLLGVVTSEVCDAPIR